MSCFKKFFNKQQGSFTLQNSERFSPNLTRYQAPQQYFINIEGQTLDETTTDPNKNERTESGISSLADAQEIFQTGQKLNNKKPEKKKKTQTAPPPPARLPPPVPKRTVSKDSDSSIEEVIKMTNKPDIHVNVIKVNQKTPEPTRPPLKEKNPKSIIKQKSSPTANHISIIKVDQHDSKSHETNDRPLEIVQSNGRPCTSSSPTEEDIMQLVLKSPKFHKKQDKLIVEDECNFETVVNKQNHVVPQVSEPETQHHELFKTEVTIKHQPIQNGVNHISDTDSDDSEIRNVEQKKLKNRSAADKQATSKTPHSLSESIVEMVKMQSTEPKVEEKKLRESTKVTKKIDELIAPPTIKNARKRGVISEKLDQSETKEAKIDTFEKDYPSQELIKRAITANDFLNNMMDVDRLDSVTSAMSPCNLEAYSYIITEGESGSYFYVSAEGTFEVLKEGKVIKSFSEGVVFGELAILYKAKRFASIRLTTPGKVWRLERKIFQKIMMQSGRKEREENIRFLSSVSLLKDVPLPILSQISDILKREFHATGATIIQQGDPGDKFYIIRGGSVNVIKTDPSGLEKLVGTLHRGAYFGEQALLHQDRRLASIIANPPGTECLTLDRLAFVNLLGGIEIIKNSKPVDNFEPSKSNSTAKTKKYEHMQLHDLTIVGTLGVGGYGRVELVQYKKTKETFALKYLKKIDMVQQQRQEHAYSEKDIMLSCDSDFIARLYKTYRDKKYLYFLMEVCLGGDVWTILQKKKFFDEKTSKFMTACVVEAFDYMHSRNMIYRDLKPENLMLDDKGYIKLVDFGFAKRVGPSQKTWTFAGTPEYVSPEIILNKGHDRAVDYWALGVFIHELLIGKPPFRGKDHMKTYNLILRGIDVIDMPQKIPKKVQVLIKRLCRQAPVERLGYQKNGIADIKNNSWFNGFDWVRLQECTMPAPLMRSVKNNTDLSNFDEYPRDREEPADETSGWDFDF